MLENYFSIFVTIQRRKNNLNRHLLKSKMGKILLINFSQLLLLLVLFSFIQLIILCL